MMPQPRRKKWAEAEERSLIEKYGEMICDGSLCKMKTREKKFKPIAHYVNSMHHSRDPLNYPWQWTWKDVSIKVQNMRHQYALVKQKIKKQECSGEEEYDWIEGITHWSNFLRYKEVFGDVSLAFVTNNGVAGECNEGFEGGDRDRDRDLDILSFDPMVGVGEGDFVVENGVMALEFNYDEDYNVSNKELVCAETSSSKKKKRGFKGVEKKAWTFVINQLNHLRKLEIRLEQEEVEREKTRQRRESNRIEMEKENEKDKEMREIKRENSRKKLIQEWEAMKRENEESEKSRREEELKHEKEIEERLKRRRLEWNKKMDEMVIRHRGEMSEIQSRILQDQQTITNQFIGIVSSDQNAPSSSHYMPQNDDENEREDRFIVDG